MDVGPYTYKLGTFVGCSKLLKSDPYYVSHPLKSIVRWNMTNTHYRSPCKPCPKWWIVTVDQFSRETLTLTSCNLCFWQGLSRRTCNLHHCFSVTYTFKGLRLQLINPFCEQIKNFNHLSKMFSRPKNVQFWVAGSVVLYT